MDESDFARFETSLESAKVLRKLTFWFSTDKKLDFNNDPCFLFELPDGIFYGFPKINERGVKVSEHSGGEIVEDIRKLNRSLVPADQEKITRFTRNSLPALGKNPTVHSVCLYTMTPDNNFIVDQHPLHSNVYLAAGFSGHGFKFASAIGEIMADLGTQGKTGQPIKFLSLKRFGVS